MTEQEHADARRWLDSLLATLPRRLEHTDGETVGPEHSAESGAHDSDAAPEADPGNDLQLGGD